MPILKVDYIHPQSTLAWTSDVENINNNLMSLAPLNEHITAKKLIDTKTPFTLMGIAGRWLLVYLENGANDDDTMLYLIDFRVDLEEGPASHLLSQATIAHLKTLQARYDPIFKPALDIYEISYGTPTEKILKPNLVSCDIDELVLQKSKSLGALHLLESAKAKNEFQVSLVDEKIYESGYETKNIFALIHFNSTATEGSGYIYIKLYDLAANLDLLVDFEQVLKRLGGNFDRVFLMEKFMPERWN